MTSPIERILIAGHKGMLGHDLMDRVRAEWPSAALTGLDIPDIDITRPDSIRAAVEAHRPQIIFNCAAFTNVDACETQTNLAMAVNGQGPGNLAAAARQAGAHFIHISTDYVFDGLKGAPYTEDDPTAPISAYGRSKLAGEEAIRAQGGTWAIARTAWLYGRHGRNFVDTMLRLAREKPELSVVTDQAGSPTWTRDLAAALCALARTGATGLFHTTNSGCCTRFEQTQAILEIAGLKTKLNPVTSAAFPRPARVPPSSPLDTSKLTHRTGHHMRPWRQALADYLAS